jgi:PBP1b-binding outer membrane lipoprotein LpoB
MSADSTNDKLFQGLVISLAAAAMQHLGKTLNPLTNKIEKNLEAAQATIDMLDMLEARTQGNLSEAEARLLKGVLAELKLNYVETLNEKPAEVEAAKKPEGAG